MTPAERVAFDGLWPGTPSGDRRVRRFRALPSAERPRLLIPTRPRRASTVVLHALRDKTSLVARAKTQLAKVPVAVGLGGLELADPDVLTKILAHLSDADYTYGVHLGPPRANRKPVLAIVTADGSLTAFAKCGVNQLTDRLVHRETDALIALVGLKSVTVPTRLGSGEHDGHRYLVQSPVPTSGIGSTDSPAVIAAQVEVAQVGSGSIDVSSALHAQMMRWRERIEAANSSGATEGFADLAESWAGEMMSLAVPWGSWHGDWRATNMAVAADGCSVWDWERFASGVPAGYDALHLFLTSQVASTNDATELPARLFAHAERLLHPFGIRTRRGAELVTTGYLLELAGRYLDDGQTQAGGQLGSVGQWLLPYLVTAPSPSPERGVNES